MYSNENSSTTSNTNKYLILTLRTWGICVSLLLSDKFIFIKNYQQEIKNYVIFVSNNK